MNKAIICGRTTAESDTRMTPSGKKVCRFTLAVDDGKDANGERRSQFIDCVAWERSAEFMERYVRKGVRILVEGRLNKQSYEKDGVKHYPTVVVADRIEFADGLQNTPTERQEQPRQETNLSNFGLDINADDLPF